MITTIDGVSKNMGDVCWYITFGGQSGEYYPKRFVVSIGDDETQMNLYHSRELCKQQCDLMNKDKI